MKRRKKRNTDYDSMGDFSRYRTMTPRESKSLETEIRLWFRNMTRHIIRKKKIS